MAHDSGPYQFSVSTKWRFQSWRSKLSTEHFLTEPGLEISKLRVYCLIWGGITRDSLLRSVRLRVLRFWCHHTLRALSHDTVLNDLNSIPWESTCNSDDKVGLINTNLSHTFDVHALFVVWYVGELHVPRLAAVSAKWCENVTTL
jgi:hypothetical protein